MPVGGRGADVDSDDEDCFKKVAVTDKTAQEAAPYLLYGRLTITVVSAELQGTAKLNPFIQLKCGGQVFKTEVDVKGDKNPKWDNSYIVELDGGNKEDNTLHLFVTDKGSLISSNIGRLDLPVEELFSHKTDGKGKEALEYQLVDPKKPKKSAGKILLKAVWDGRGMPWQTDLDTGSGGREGKKAILMKGKLTVTVHRAENLRHVQLIGKQDPYVEIRFGQYAYKTKVHEKAGQFPIWNQDFIFNVEHSQSEQFSFLVYDKEPLVDNKIARIDLSIGKLLMKKDREQMLQLVFWENFHKIGGELYVTASYVGEGAPITEEDLKKAEAKRRKEDEEAQEKLRQLDQVAQDVRKETEKQANDFIRGLHEKHMAELKRQQDEFALQQENFRREKEAFEAHQRELAAAKELADREAKRLRDEAEMKKEPPMEVREESHPHPLKLLPTIYKGQYVCDKCQVRGSGRVYHCDICKFDMHPSCTVEYAAWQGSRPVPIIPQLRDFRHHHPLLKLPSVYQGSYDCANCKAKLKGEVYHCDLCRWDICPKCVALTS